MTNSTVVAVDQVVLEIILANNSVRSYKIVQFMVDSELAHGRLQLQLVCVPYLSRI